MSKKLIELFETVQAIPYKCRTDNNVNLDLHLKHANCRQKRDLLKVELENNGILSKRIDAIFNWSDLSIPDRIIRTLKKSGTLQKHHLLEIKIGENHIKIDPTWDLELELFGFPITKNWNGYSDTCQVTYGGIVFYDPRIQKVSLPYHPDERIEFANEFNEWVGRKL